VQCYYKQFFHNLLWRFFFLMLQLMCELEWKWHADFVDICSATGLNMADVTATLKSLNMLKSPILRYVVFAAVSFCWVFMRCRAMFRLCFSPSILQDREQSLVMKTLNFSIAVRHVTRLYRDASVMLIE
jgi:hypothetical protein